jgi:hypothetical protein
LHKVNGDMDNFAARFKSLLPTVHQHNFNEVALSLFNFQYLHNSLYHDFCNHLHRTPAKVKSIEEIPFLPIEFFKNHQVVSNQREHYTIFESSGTSDATHTSKHYVADVAFYLQHAASIFNAQYGAIEGYTILALLPNYLERSNSSLIAMVDDFIKKSNNVDSGYYLYNHEALIEKLMHRKGKTMLIGVTFALLDLAENFSIDLHDVVVMETGGMKGKRQELLREEVHRILNQSFNTTHIHSEYGMTELLSQAYSKGKGIFETPSSMKILLREINDPLTINNQLRYGGINVIDLANIDSCAFIATQDLGKITAEGHFEVIGRFDSSDVRGCNLMVF